MKITELISELEKHLDMVGDVEVTILYPEDVRHCFETTVEKAEHLKSDGHFEDRICLYL